MQQEKTTSVIFSLTLRKLAKLQKKTQIEIAQAAGVSQAAVSKWFTGAIPAAQLLQKVASFLGKSPYAMLDGSILASLIRTDEDKADLLESPVGREIWRQLQHQPKYEDTADGKSKAHVFEVSPAPPLKNLRLVPVVSYAMAGKAADYDDLANFLDETIETDCKDANCFALIVEGDSMEPAIRAGDRVVVMPNSEAQTGDIVVARRRDTHEVFVKLVHFTDSHRRVKFTSYNPAYPPLEFSRKDFRFIYPVHSMQRVFRRSENGHTGKR